MTNADLIRGLEQLKERINPPGRVFYSFDDEQLEAILSRLKTAEKMARLLPILLSDLNLKNKANAFDIARQLLEEWNR